MAIQLVFSKSDDAPWGFRLTGGAECEIPLTVIKVAEGSIADHAGLQVEDIILQINQEDLADLSHDEAHNVLMNAGQNFTMTIIRSDPTSINDDDQHNEEIKNILEHTYQSLENDNYQPVTGLNGYEKMHSPTRVRLEDTDAQDYEQTSHQKKWSTFLQKPIRPIPSPKKKEGEQPLSEPYRVVIKKQPKKSTENHIETQPLEEEVLQEILNENEQPDNIPTEEPEEPTENYSVEEMYDNVNEYQDDEEFEVQSYTYEENEDVELPGVPEVYFLEEPEKPVTLEEQLALIQQQLQSLAQVPTSIQTTLEALTEQLAKIVGVPQTEENLDVYREEENQVASGDDDSLQSIVEEEVAETIDNYKMDVTDTSDISDTEAHEAYHEDDQVSQGAELMKQMEEEDAARERAQLELKKSAKLERTEEFHQRRLEQRPTIPLAPVQRPIVLPGGRKWCAPDDALPKPKKSKMTDEKICKTLDTYSEIITGHTKGINFLKYQPAPKNMDYLQRSEVFRMIHDTDPPKSGIAARSGVVVSEEDYYSEKPGQRASLKA